MTKDLCFPKYRSDIDGLRAIAILLVVFFHAFPHVFESGFIGVDVFFVISGFLISSILFESFHQSCFSYLTFYVRRINRLFPPLFLVLVACYALGCFFLTQEDHEGLIQHMVAACVFVPNILFWKESSHLDVVLETKPLLHLWSLGVEEQFYILWPFLIDFFRRLRWNFFFVFSFLFVISFVAGWIEMYRDFFAAFYFPWNRAWELFAGAFLAYLSVFKKMKSFHDQEKLCSFVSFLGLLLLSFGVFCLDEKTPFPGWAALLPVSGTFLMIASGPEAWLNRVCLSWKPLVGLGTVSYAWYLWHWPLLSFVQIVEDKLTSVAAIVVILVSLGLAMLTYYAVERPLLSLKSSQLQAIILLFLMFSMALCLSY